jgi:NADPH:quinone reductase-like Zn-dependent oxidoreductase
MSLQIMPRTHMPAAVTLAYGPGGTRLSPVERPCATSLPPHHLLVRVAFAALSPADALHASGSQRHTNPMPLPAVLGSDFSGTVVASARGSSPFPPGARVFGRAQRGTGGACAELIAVDGRRCAAVPDGMSLSDAAAVAGCGVYALAACRAAHLRAGESVLVLGASSSEGCLVAQIALATVGQEGRVVALCADPRDAKWLGHVLRPAGGEAHCGWAAAEAMADVRPNVIFDCTGRHSKYDVVCATCPRESRYVGFAMADYEWCGEDDLVVGRSEGEYARLAVESMRVMARRLAGLWIRPSFHEVTSASMMEGGDVGLSFPKDVAPLLKSAKVRIRSQIFRLHKIAAAYAALESTRRAQGPARGKVVLAIE